jgi:hypothetical protein
VKNFWLAAAVIAASGCVSEIDSSSGLGESNETQELNEPPKLGMHWAKGQAGGGGSRANMFWHNGAIMKTAHTQAIFWGTSWAGYSGDKMTGLDTWYQGYGGSAYARTSDEYTGYDLGTSNTVQVTAATTHLGHLVDTSPATGGNSTAAILAEVCKEITSPVVDGYYAVYTDVPRGNAGYCAWHSFGSCAGVNVQFAFFFSLDGDSGCDPQDTSGQHSQGLAALANVSGHELSEARTDPRNGGWLDRQGGENGDKCAWSYGANLLTFSNGSQWKIQGEWSNSSFNSSTGYPNRSGQRGCLDGSAQYPAIAP